MQIEVTQEDIDKGKRADCSECPLALAITRATLRPVDIYSGRANFYFSSGSASIVLPKIAADFYFNFDRQIPVSPFTFTLDYKP